MTAVPADIRPPGPGAATLEAVAVRLAELLTGAGPTLSDGEGSELDFEAVIEPRPLSVSGSVGEVWAVDGGQALVADARCLQVYVTRAATVCWRDGSSVVEDGRSAPGPPARRGARNGRPGRGRPRAGRGTPVDVNLLRDWAEWEAVSVRHRAAGAGRPGPGRRRPAAGLAHPGGLVAGLFERAAARNVTLVGRDQALVPCPGRGAAARPAGDEAPRAPRAGLAGGRRSAGPGRLPWPGLQVVVARLDPDARFAFRVDLPIGTDAEPALGPAGRRVE